MQNKKTFTICLLLFLCLIVLSGCTLLPSLSKECSHNYYLSDYSAASSSKNGYNLFTCSECGNTYKETIPATDASGTETNSSKKSSSQVPLLSLPVYSQSNDIVSIVEYKSSTEDIDAWKHTDCYTICCEDSNTSLENFLRWELDEQYSTVSGTIYMKQGADNSYWLTFYDGDKLLYTTSRLTSENTSVSFEFNVSNVEYLTMYAWLDGLSYNGCWIIADNIYIE